jgi:membrane protein implicated in regulation of membrane protease activity
MLLSPSLVWLVIGIVAMLIEILAIIPGIGLLFIGLAALSVGILVTTEMGATVGLIGQSVWFFGLTVVYAVLLWKPLKRWRISSAKGETYNNMVGDTAIVIENPLQQGIMGKVRWSGTIMNAKLHENGATAPLDATVKIIAVEGNILIVQ